MNYLSILAAAIAALVNAGAKAAQQHWYGGTPAGKAQNVAQIGEDVAGAVEETASLIPSPVVANAAAIVRAAATGAGTIAQNLANSAAATTDLHPAISAAAEAISNGAHPVDATRPPAAESPEQSGNTGFTAPNAG